MPALLSSLINVPREELSAVLAPDGVPRPCLREWLAGVPDPRSPLGRWHPLEFVLALAVCAFTAVGHDSPSAIADWACGCSQEVLVILGGRRDPWTRQVRPPCERTFRRVFTRVDAVAFNDVVHGYLAALPQAALDALPETARHEREQRRAAAQARRPAVPGLLPQAAADGKTARGAVRPDGSQVHLLSAFHVGEGRTLAQREVAAKTNEIPELSPCIEGLDLAGMVLTLDALHTQRETARRTAQAPATWPSMPGSTGGSRTASTTPGTRHSAKTCSKCAPGTSPAPMPPSATWSSAPSAAPGMPTSPTPAATTPATTSASSPSTATPEQTSRPSSHARHTLSRALAGD